LDGWPTCIPVQGTEDWSLNHVKANTKETFWNVDFLHKVFSSLSEFKTKTLLQDRKKIAFENLVKADLLYRAHVLWTEDPLREFSHSKAKPLYVVYVENSKSPDCEISLHESIKKTVIDTNTLDAKQIYGNGTKAQYLYVNGHFGYMVDGADSQTAMMLTIYRARWWASDEKTMQSIQDCSDRTLEAKNSLDSVVEMALSGEYIDID
jgi:hypothetical protein